MDMLQPTHFVDERPIPHATSIDFCRALTEELQSLYLLSLLLTADNDKAEQCFVSAIGECGEDCGVFREWASSWVRRAVVKHAIRTIKPSPDQPDTLPFIIRNRPATSPGNETLATIVALGAFERFVFVMSILEEQSEQDCAILLRCSRRNITIARELALTRLAKADADELMQA
jgi:hypothetical protein